MSRQRKTVSWVAALAVGVKSTSLPRGRALALVAAGVLGVMAVAPATAEAHGPIAPVASSYLARITRVPSGLDAKVVDGDLRMWLQAPANETVLVLDYRGAPYLRFARSGVWVNHNSAMYYLNQTPFPLAVPAHLGPKTPPRWQLVTSAHDYGWHDGRLHALAAVALSAGQSYVGRWRVPLLVNGRVTSISGGLWHAADPSIVWFWPIVVLLMCVLAAWRVKRTAVDRWTTDALGIAALVAMTVAGFSRGLHGRPTVSTLQLVELAALLAFVAWALQRIARHRAGYFSYFLIALMALFEGAELIPTLLNGFALVAMPAFVTRAATVVALGSGVGLLLMVFRVFDRDEADRDQAEPDEVSFAEEGEDDSALELA